MVIKLVAVMCLAVSSVLALPNGGQRVEYIQTDGKSWIDSGITDGYFRESIIDCSSPSTSPDTCMLGVRSSFEMLHFWSGICVEFFGEYWTYNVITNNQRIVVDSVVSSNTVNTYLDGVLLGTITGRLTLKSKTMHIFAANGSTDNRPMPKGSKLYSLRLFADSALVRSFVPALDSTNVPCLYDKVSKSYFYNAGTGTFTAGPLIRESGYGIRTAFRPLGGAQ